MRIEESKIEEIAESLKKAEAEEAKPKIKEKEKTWKIIAKYLERRIP